MSTTLTPAARAKQAHAQAMQALEAQKLNDIQAIATLPAGATVTVADAYKASLESCSSFYIANGGNPAHNWTIQPYPGTAAISFDGWHSWTLCMPAMPLDARLSRREAELMVAYTVHELGHALYTDFEVMKEAQREGLMNLLNSLEDIRIERDLVANAKGVSNARALLQMLTEYVTVQSLSSGWDPSAPRCLPFTLVSKGMTEVLGYAVASMPKLDVLPPAILALLDETLVRVRATPEGKVGTAECLAIARWLKAAIEALPREAKPEPGSKPEPASQKAPEAPEASDATSEAPEASDATPEAPEAPEASDAAPEAPEASDATPETPEASDETQDSLPSGPAGGDTDGGGSPWSLDDANTENPEVNLDDMGERTSKRAGQAPDDVARENRGVMDYLNATPCKTVRRKSLTPNERVAKVLTGMIPTPAKLRRDVTRALRSPDMTLNHRHETRGRFDMRDVSRAQAGAVNVFRRREETLGENTAVSFLIDLSTSMRGSTIEATTALALHLGDACKASNIAFEVLGFLSPGPKNMNPNRPTAILSEIKSFKDPWQEARPFVASLVDAPNGGTSMMPAMIDTAKRLKAKSGVSRRVMVVLTDGQDGWSVQSARAAAKTALTRDGVETLMIGALQDVSHLGLAHVNVTSLSALATQGLEALGKALEAKPHA